MASTGAATTTVTSVTTAASAAQPMEIADPTSTATTTTSTATNTTTMTRLFDNERVFLSEDVPAIGDPAAPLAPLSDVILARGGTLSPDVATATLVILTAEKMKIALERRGGGGGGGARVVSTRCVRESLEMGKTLPSGGQYVLCRAFDGIVLACDIDVLAELGTDMREMVELMSGRFVGDQLPADATMFCGKTAMSQGFQVASQRSLPIVRPAWVAACFRAQALLPITPEFALPPLAGCVACVTGFSVMSRQNIQQMVVSLGGSFSPELSKRCTHLIAVAPTGPKYRASQIWRIPAVNLDWILDSVNMKACQPTAPYIVHDIAAETAFALSGVNAAAAAAVAAASNSGGAGTAMQQQQQQSAQALLYQHGAAATNSGVARHRRRVSEGPAPHRQALSLLAQQAPAAQTVLQPASAGSAPMPSALSLSALRYEPYVPRSSALYWLPRSAVLVNTPVANPAAASTAAMVASAPGPIQRASSPSESNWLESSGVQHTPASTAVISSTTVSGSSQAPITFEQTVTKLQAALLQVLDLCDAIAAFLQQQQAAAKVDK